MMPAQLPTTSRTPVTSSGETVLTLATPADERRLRSELLRLILQSESRRRGPRPRTKQPETSPTDGSANSSLRVDPA